MGAPAKIENLFRLPTDEHQYHGRTDVPPTSRVDESKEVSQSERDWAYAKRHRGDGESPDTVIQAIAHLRQDKARPEYCARQTVTRAYASVALRRGDRPEMVQHRVATHARR